MRWWRRRCAPDAYANVRRNDVPVSEAASVATALRIASYTSFDPVTYCVYVARPS
jgi:hypothetical protein